MSKLFILKFDTCVRSDIQHLKHTEPIAFAGFVQTMFDAVYVFGDPENKHAILDELVHDKVARYAEVRKIRRLRNILAGLKGCS